MFPHCAVRITPAFVMISGLFNCQHNAAEIKHFHLCYLLLSLSGLVKNMARGDMYQYGASFKVAYMTNYQVTNQLSCFQNNGSSDMTIAPQTIFPDTTGMQVGSCCLCSLSHYVKAMYFNVSLS
jgi:hypothetical protein